MQQTDRPPTFAQLFVDDAAGDFRLKPGAPVIDLGDAATSQSGRGSDAASGARFVDGVSLLTGGTIDLGGYEYQNYQPTKPAVTVTPVTAQVGQPIQFTASSTDANGDSLSYAWGFGDGSPGTNEQNPTYTFTQAGTYNVQVSANDSQLQSETTDSLVTITAAPVIPIAPVTPALFVASRSSKTFKRGRKAFALAPGVVRGIAVEANVAMPVTLSLAKRKGGFVAGTKCVKRKPRSGKVKRCDLKLKGSQALNVPAGKSTITFGGKFGGKKLAAGKYVLTVTASGIKDGKKSFFSVIR